MLHHYSPLAGNDCAEGKIRGGLSDPRARAHIEGLDDDARGCRRDVQRRRRADPKTASHLLAVHCLRLCRRSDLRHHRVVAQLEELRPHLDGGLAIDVEEEPGD